MRISTKVSFGFALLAAIVFGGIGAAQVAAEKRDLERVFFEETATLCRTAAESLRHDHPEQESVESRALLSSLVRFDDDLSVVLWGVETPHFGRMSLSDPQQREWASTAGREAVMHGTLVQRVVEGPEEGRTAVIAAPIGTSRDIGALVMLHPLDAIDADVHHEAAMTALGVLIFTISSGLLGFALGEAYIARPLRHLDDAMSVVASGTLDAPALEGRSDEVGRILRHFDEMREELSKARDRLETEQDAHRMTLERLARADRLATVGQLAAGLAHEIGSPLQILHGRAQKLADRVEDAESAKTARIIVAQTERITRIVQQLLQFARARPAKHQDVDPARCLEPVIDLLELEANRRGVEIRLDAPQGSSVRIDADALQQIVFNLARNGLAALKEGGRVELSLRVEGRSDPRVLELTVSDDGTGMPEETRERIFQPFFTTRAHLGGVGLGLTVVRSLVESAGGTVSVSSRPTRGTTFVVRIPC